MSAITFYTKPGCTLCLEVLEALRMLDVNFDTVDISTDQSLQAEFGSLVPVVEVDGNPVFLGGMDPASLPELLGPLSL